MLILTRRVGESLRIGDEISVTVLGIKGSQVRIGVNAPKVHFCFIGKKFMTGLMIKKLLKGILKKKIKTLMRT